MKGGGGRLTLSTAWFHGLRAKDTPLHVFHDCYFTTVTGLNFGDVITNSSANYNLTVFLFLLW